MKGTFWSAPDAFRVSINFPRVGQTAANSA